MTTADASNSTPWHTDKWFTGPLNFEPEVQAQLAFPPSLEIHDVTLRDGEQQTGVVFNADDKVRIAEALAEAGVHRIEAGIPAVSPEDMKAVKRIAGAGLPSKVFAFSRCMLDDVKLALECGVDGVVMEIPSSRHLIEIGYQWSVDRAIDLSAEATSFAHENGLTVSFFPIDATRAGSDEYARLVESVARDGHMDALGLVDTFGVLTPHSVQRFVERSSRFGVPLETHFHMDFGLGVANTLVAAAAGASVLQTTVSGIGERAGNTPMEETLLALLTLYGQDIGIRTEHLTGIARLVAELSGVEQPSNRAVTGSRLFQIESGIPATFWRNARDVDPTEVFPYLPSLVGQPEPETVLGKGSGIDNVLDALDRVGLQATTEQARAMMTEVKAMSLEKRRLLTLDEFTDIAQRVLG